MARTKETVDAVPEDANGEAGVKARVVKNQARAGQTIFAITGAPIVFDSKGFANASEADLEYLLTVPGYKGA